MLAVRNLEVVYHRVVLVLKGVSLTVPEGGIACVLGPNGAGKTTLLRALTGLLSIHDGEVTEGSTTLGTARLDRQRADAIVRLGISQVMEGRRILGELSVEDNLRAGAIAVPRAVLDERLERAFQRFPVLGKRRRQPAGYLSGGYGLGAAFVPMYQSQRPKEWQFILDDCGARAVIVATEATFDVLHKLRGNLPALRHVISLARPDGEASWSSLLAAGASRPVAAISPDPQSVAGFIYTSGTTGKPKGALLSHRNITSNIQAVHQLYQLTPDDRSLSFLPRAHSVTREIAGKPELTRKIIQHGLAQAVKRTRGEPLTPFDRLELALDDTLIFQKIRDKLGGRLRYAFTGSAPIAREVIEFIDALGIEVYEGYGLTETSPVVTTNSPGHRKFGSVGRVLPGVEVKIDTSVTEDHKDGEVIVHGPNVMLGYHNRPEENEQTLMPDGGLRTGDLGHFDADGYLYITGRIKEQYKLENGKYVMPSVLEEALKLSPFIANVMIYGDGRPYNVALVVPDLQAVQGPFYVPLATTEGTLVASYNRGMRLLNACGGAKATVVEQFMQRAPVFVLTDAVAARDFGDWVCEHLDAIKREAESTTRVGKLHHIEQYQVGPARFLRFNYTTGDAAGQNMCGKATAAACAWIAAHWPGKLDYLLSGNIDTDKKHSTLNALHTRGRRVVAEVVLHKTYHDRATAHQPRALRLQALRGQKYPYPGLSPEEYRSAHRPARRDPPRTVHQAPRSGAAAHTLGALASRCPCPVDQLTEPGDREVAVSLEQLLDERALRLDARDHLGTRWTGRVQDADVAGPITISSDPVHWHWPRRYAKTR
jgi:long-chain acyl-CoA synthetase